MPFKKPLQPPPPPTQRFPAIAPRHFLPCLLAASLTLLTGCKEAMDLRAEVSRLEAGTTAGQAELATVEKELYAVYGRIPARYTATNPASGIRRGMLENDLAATEKQLADLRAREAKASEWLRSLKDVSVDKPSLQTP